MSPSQWEDLESLGTEDVVEVVDELAGAVTHEGSGLCELLWVAQQQVSRGLGGPGCGGLAVIPAKNTRRVGMSMKNNT